MAPQPLFRQSWTTLVGLFRELRPKQWYKQSLLFVGVVFSGNLVHATQLRDVTIAVIAFGAAAGTVYLFNDIMDRGADRNHPTKRHRPIASGQVSVLEAGLFGVALLAVSLWLSLGLNSSFFAIVLLYLGQNAIYSLVLKRVPFVDIALVASGFLLRAIGGVVVIDAAISPWLVLCTFLLALLMVLAKRYHELAFVDHASRDVFETYSQPLLKRAMRVTGVALTLSYGLYSILGRTPVMVISFPFVCLGIIRFFRLTDTSRQAPLPVSLLKDARFFGYVSGWAVSVVAVIYFVQGA